MANSTKEFGPATDAEITVPPFVFGFLLFIGNYTTCSNNISVDVHVRTWECLLRTTRNKYDFAILTCDIASMLKHLLVWKCNIVGCHVD